MLGLLDFFGSYGKQGNYLPNKIFIEEINSRKSKYHWIWFMPESFLNSKLKNKILPANDNYTIYCIPKTIIQKNPYKTKNFLKRIENKAINKCSMLSKKYNLCIGALSIGNVLAYNLADRFKILRLVSIVPGANLAKCSKDSIKTKSIVRSSDLHFSEWEGALKEFNPSEKLNNLLDIELYIYLANFDLFIKRKHGNDLLKAIYSAGLKPKVKKYLFLGHIAAILNCSLSKKSFYD